MKRKITLLVTILFILVNLTGCSLFYDTTLKKGIIFKKTYSQELTSFFGIMDVENTTYTIYYEAEQKDGSFVLSYQDVTVDEFYCYSLGDEYTRKAED